MVGGQRSLVSDQWSAVGIYWSATSVVSSQQRTVGGGGRPASTDGTVPLRARTLRLGNRCPLHCEGRYGRVVTDVIIDQLPEDE